MKRKGIIKTREFIKLRTKDTSNGNQSLYLDIYKEGKRSYEFLKLYLIPELTPEDKSANRETIREAEMIKARRNWELYCTIMENSADEQPTHELSLIEWLRHYSQRKLEKGQSDAYHKQINKAIKHLLTYRKDDIKLSDVNKEYCVGYINYLNSTSLALTTTVSYFRCLSCALNTAVNEGVIPSNPINQISKDDKIRLPDSSRNYLTINEIMKIIATPCKNEEVKRAYLFSCMTGLRLSDIKNLKWENLEKDEERWKVTILTVKTQKYLCLPLSNEAIEWLPKRSGTRDPYIYHLPSDSYANVVIKKWMIRSGINKYITFHTARHTYATMLITLGADIYTVSKLLGHSQIKTTQVYAKIVDKKKEEAISRIPRFTAHSDDKV